MQAMQIRVVTGNDWGCPHTTADEAAFARALSDAVLVAYPGADVKVTVRGSIDHTRVNVYVCRPEDEPEIVDTVRELARRVWDDAEFWPSESNK
jgi:hypothetical protein